MNKEPKFIAVLVIVFIFGIQLLVIESYQSLFQTSEANKNNYFTISTIEEDDDDNNDGGDDNNDGGDDNNDGGDDNNENLEFDSEICIKLLDSETCKKMEEEIKSKSEKSPSEKSTSEKLSKEDIQAEEIVNKYLEPVQPSQDQINTMEQTNENTQTDNFGNVPNDITESGINSQNPTSIPSSPTPTPTNTTVNTSPIDPSSSTPSFSLANVNTLGQNQLIDAIASEISKLKNFDKNSLTQALFELAQATAAQGGDVMKNLRQIGTTILQNPADPMIDRIIALAQPK